jgi:hypothetical protein
VLTAFRLSPRRTAPTCSGWLAREALPSDARADHHHRTIVVLEGVIAFVFMERHWQAVTRRCRRPPRAIAAVIDIYNDERPHAAHEMARDRLNPSCRSCRPAICQPRAPVLFALLDRARRMRSPPGSVRSGSTR